MVKDVPAAVCNTCREPYLDENVTQRLLDLAREVSAAGVGGGVRRYAVS